MIQFVPQVQSCSVVLAHVFQFIVYKYEIQVLLFGFASKCEFLISGSASSAFGNKISVMMFGSATMSVWQ